MRTLNPGAPVIAALVLVYATIAYGQVASSAPLEVVASKARVGARAGHAQGQAAAAPSPTPAPQQDHSQHQEPARTEQPASIPPITDENRRAAFPDVTGRAVHDNAINYFVLFD